MVAAIVHGQDSRRVGWVAQDGIKINHAVIGSARADKFVYRLALGLALRREVSGSFKWCQGATHDFEPLLMRARDHLPVPGDDLVGGHGLRSPAGLDYRRQAADVAD